MKKFSMVLATIVCSSSLYAGVIATYSGGKITDEDVAPYLAQYKIPNISALPKDAKESLIKEALAKKLLAKEAIKAKIDKSPAFIANLESTKEALLAQQYLLNKFDAVKVSDAEAKEYYNKHLSEFKVPEAVKAAHILVKTEAEANSIIAELKGKKGDALKTKFIELAKAKSLDKGSAAMGGELPYMSANELVPEFFNAARKLKSEEISAPVKSQFGYHVIYGIDHKVERQGSFEEAKNFIVGALKADKHRKLVAAETKKLVDSAKLSIK